MATRMTKRENSFLFSRTEEREQKVNWPCNRRIASGLADINNDYSCIHFLEFNYTNTNHPYSYPFYSACCFGGNITLSLSCIQGQVQQ